MLKKLLLNQARNVESDKSNITFPIEVNTNKEIIVDDKFNEAVNEYNVYLDEREACSTVRLTATVNLIASNAIFNSVTEIVKDEGSENCVCLNYEPKTIDSTVGKSTSYVWGGTNITDAVMDTQISYDGEADKNYTYLCGIDIFNNHIMRSKTPFPAFWSGQQNESEYNTISEYMTDVWTDTIRQTTFKEVYQWIAFTRKAHRYNKKNIQTFADSLFKNLTEDKGWVGFINKSQMRPLSILLNYDGTDRVINNIGANRFIDLFPGRDRYKFLPHYNEYRDRYEKNWEYCITYPYSSTTENIDFIDGNLDTLKIAFIDENEQDDFEVYRCVVYSISKHGLKPNDMINMYRSTMDGSASELVESEMLVEEVIDDYAFTVYPTEWVCKKWLSIFDKESVYHPVQKFGDIFSVKPTPTSTTTVDEQSINDYLNIDYDEYDGNTVTHIGSKNLSFAKVVDGQQCRYYVRILSRLPNFEFYPDELTKYNIYNEDNGIRPVDEYADIEYERQSTLSKLGFSKNIYGDDICQIVYNDDISIDLLKDNLGRPLTSLYLTFFKTNYGYKEWYGKEENAYKGEDVEWSRCFGKLNCGFELSPYIDYTKFRQGNVAVMNNVDKVLGIDESIFNGNDDEILYKEQKLFYGDLCMYSPSECLETSIQDCCHRFNTAQRELSGDSGHFAADKFASVEYTDIRIDDYEGPLGKFATTTAVYDSEPTAHPEGYYYHPNYEIPVRELSGKLYEFSPNMLDIISISSESANGQYKYTARVSKESYFDYDTNLYLYCSQTDSDYQCNIVNITDVDVIVFTCYIDNSLVNKDTCKLYGKNVIVPEYAELVPGKSGTYRWRELIQNGFGDEDSKIPEYPFVNGCFYINKRINLFLRRQDPYGMNGLSTRTAYFGLPQLLGEENPVENGTAPRVHDALKESDSRC